MYAVRKYPFYYSGTFNAPRDDYIRDAAGLIYGLATRVEAEEIVAALEAQQSGPYEYKHNEAGRPSYDVRRIRDDSNRVRRVTLAQLGDETNLDVGLEIA